MDIFCVTDISPGAEGIVALRFLILSVQEDELCPFKLRWCKRLSLPGLLLAGMATGLGVLNTLLSWGAQPAGTSQGWWQVVVEGISALHSAASTIRALPSGKGWSWCGEQLPALVNQQHAEIGAFTPSTAQSECIHAARLRGQHSLESGQGNLGLFDLFIWIGYSCWRELFFFAIQDFPFFKSVLKLLLCF